MLDFLIDKRCWKARTKEDIRLDASQVAGESTPHLRFMCLLPLLEHIGRIGFRLAVHQSMMIPTKQNQILGRIQIFFGKLGLSSRASFTDRINVAYVTRYDSVRLSRSGLNESGSAFWVCTLVSA